MARVRRTIGILSWALPCVLLPLALRIVGANTASTAQDWVLSFDIPLALLLTVVVTVQATPAVVRAPGHHDDAWVFPVANQRLIALFQWMRNQWLAGRWPVRFAMAGFVLGIGAIGTALTEWLLIAALSWFAGVLLARLQAPSTSLGLRKWSGTSHGRGLSTLSAVPLRAAWRQLDLRRVMFLCIPILLAAPMGTPLSRIALGIAAWMPLVYVATCCREAANAMQAMQRWLPVSRARLRWWVWRHVLLLLIAAAAASWALSHFATFLNPRSKA